MRLARHDIFGAITPIVFIRHRRLITAQPELCIFDDCHANRIDVMGVNQDHGPDAGRSRIALRPGCNVEMIPSAVACMVHP